MAVFDVRKDVNEAITEIVFAEAEDDAGFSVAYKLSNEFNDVTIWDDQDESVRVRSIEHAQNLIKALNKAIELGWLK